MRCTAVFDGTNTTFTIPATPYWNPISAGAMTIGVDLYQAMPAGYGCDGNPATAGNPASLAAVGTNVTITKASTGDLTVTAVGDYSLAKWLIPHLHFSGVQFLPEVDDNSPKGDYVAVQWNFNNRYSPTGDVWQSNHGYYTNGVTINDANGNQQMVTTHGGNSGMSAPTWATTLGATTTDGAVTWTCSAVAPAWYGGLRGVVSCTVEDKKLKFVPCCPSLIGFVPTYSSQPAEQFHNQNLTAMPATVTVDDQYPALGWQGFVAQAMPDPFWQTPFCPDATAEVIWKEDDGTGLEDYDVVLDTGRTVHHWFYAHHPLVEARHTYPTNLGFSGTETAPNLPADALMEYDAANTIAPIDYPYGIPIPSSPAFVGIVGVDAGGWTTYETVYGFYARACANIAAGHRFSDVYSTFCYC